MKPGVHRVIVDRAALVEHNLAKWERIDALERELVKARELVTRWEDAADDLTARLDASERRAAALAEALEPLRRAWDGLTRCTDEFGPDHHPACGEWEIALETAIVAALAAAADGD